MTDNKADNTESSQQPSADHPESVSQPEARTAGVEFYRQHGHHALSSTGLGT